MIMCTYKKICITDIALAGGEDAMLFKINLAYKNGADIVILRAKELSSGDYYKLALKALKIARENNGKLYLHSFVDVAKKLEARSIHLTMEGLRNLSEEDKAFFKEIGASCHSLEDATAAKALGATYITASHIFETTCKPGLKPKGLEFLHEICQKLDLPVYALGGIDESNAPSCIKAGAAGVCMMGEYMRG